MARQDDIDHVRGSVWLLAAALALVALAILLLLRPLLSRGAPPAAHDAPAVAGAPTGDGARSGVRRQPAVPGDDTRPARPVPRRDLAPPPRAAASGDTGGSEDTADDAGAGDDEPSGIALFPPPGTNPPKPGLIVPDDFELPPGYVRHHQVTDDGTLLPPILMFHPDYDWVDANGQRITLPDDHVVPPELAPPGMPLSRLEIPDSHIEAVEPPPPGADFEAAEPDR